MYNCPAVDAAPVLASVCVAGCYASHPQASCKKECATAVNTATGQITKVIVAMTALLPTNNLTNVAYTPLIATLNDVSANLTAAKDDLMALAKVAAPAGVTVDSALRLLTTALAYFRTLNFMTSVALNPSIPDLQTLIQKVVSCANNNATDCAEIFAMYRRVAAAVNTKATVTNEMTSQLVAITSALEKTLTTGDTSTLRTTGQTFGALIGKTAGNAAKYVDFSNSLLYINAALKTPKFVPYFGTIAAPFRYMLEAVKKIADCLSTGTATTADAIAVDKLKLERDGEEKVELLEDDEQEQQPLMIEQSKRMLAEV